MREDELLPTLTKPATKQPKKHKKETFLETTENNEKKHKSKSDKPKKSKAAKEDNSKDIKKSTHKNGKDSHSKHKKEKKSSRNKSDTKTGYEEASGISTSNQEFM